MDVWLSPVTCRTANDVRAITQAKVKMRRQHNIQ
jgi:hypothetical protein